MNLEVSEIRYTGEEIRDMFRRVEASLDQVILGENSDLDHVNRDLNLVTSVEGEPVKISWELSDYSVMFSTGELVVDALPEKEGVLEELTATLTYTEDDTYQEQYTFQAMLQRPVLTAEEQLQEEVRKQLAETEARSPEESLVTLPESVDGKTVSYYRAMDRRGLVLILLAPVIAFLFKALERQRQQEAEEKRRKQLLRDYPELLMKMTIFIGAGMTAKRAWRQIVRDYETRNSHYEESYLYKEMLLACNEMESGVTEANSYLNFGRRCDLPEYIRFSALLSQNLRKGTRGLTELLRTESIQALEERKAYAKRLGEEAGTKLLIPMFLMLAIVLVIVMVPAFLSMKL